MLRLLRLIVWSAAALALTLGAVVGACASEARNRETRLAADVAPQSGRFVRAYDVNVYIQETGPRDGRPLLFVHGFGAWSQTWSDVIGPLAAAGYRCIAVDMPPFGFSERPAASAYTRADHARRIIGVLDALQIERATLVGHSYGGGATMEAALSAPQRFNALVLIAIAVDPQPGPVAERQTPAAVDALFGVTQLRDAVVATTLTNPRLSSVLLQRFVADPAVVTPERVHLYQQPMLLAGSTAALGEWLRRDMLASHAGALSSDARNYGRVAVPALLVWGDRDTVTPLAQGQRLAGLIPGARLVTLDGIGHIPQIEDPARVARTVLPFLTGLGQ